MGYRIRDGIQDQRWDIGWEMGDGRWEMGWEIMKNKMRKINP